MKLRTVLFIILIVQLTATAQQDDRVYKNHISISPLRLIDPVHSAIELSYERRHAPKYAVQLSAGYFIPGIFNAAYTNYKGFRVGVEEKYFFPYRTRNIYLSAEAVYQKNSYNTIGGFIHDSTATARSFHYTDSIKIKRRAMIFNIRAGRQIIVNRFVMDVSAGIGVRFRKGIHEEKIYPGDQLVDPRHPNIQHEANREKNDAAFNLPLNLRIGFRF